MTQPLYIFGRFHAKAGAEEALAQAIREVITATRTETGCKSIDAFRSIRDARLFYIHSRWIDEDAFDDHGRLPHTKTFLAAAVELIDHPLDVTRARPLS